MTKPYTKKYYFDKIFTVTVSTTLQFQAGMSRELYAKATDMIAMMMVAAAKELRMDKLDFVREYEEYAQEAIKQMEGK
jgi:hypothetical protein